MNIHRKLAALHEFAMEKLILLSGGITIITVLLIFVFLLRDALPALKAVHLLPLLTGQSWYPNSDEYGMLPLILGSLQVTIGAIIVGVPIGVAAAVYIGEIANERVREILKPTIETLAAIPSVVIGFLGLVLLVPFIQQKFHLAQGGLTALTGAIMLAFMAMPTIISISEDALHAVPQQFREASMALGATKWQTISHVVVPAARNGILASVMLGIGRAIGETMTVMMVTGNAAILPNWHQGLGFLQPVRTLTATIAAEMGETVQNDTHYYVLFALGTVLFLITFAINLIADIALQRSRR
ncbi:MAG TPA: phosphate ABC transporter permease subunit PstC [Armatimonadota bacterium]|jgi:phosphate transport system permease protein